MRQQPTLGGFFIGDILIDIKPVDSHFPTIVLLALVVLEVAAGCIEVVPKDWGVVAVGGYPAALVPCHKSLFLADFKFQVPECMPTTILSRYEASIAAIILRCSARAVPPTNRVGARCPLDAGATSVPLGYQLCAVTSMPTKFTINSGKGLIDCKRAINHVYRRQGN